MKYDILRIYDSSFLQFLRDPDRGPLINDTIIPVIEAPPERAFSEMADMIGLPYDHPVNTSSDGSTQRNREEVLRSDASLFPTPFISVHRMDFTFDLSRSQVNRWRKLKFADATKSDWIQSKHPLPYNLMYQLDTHCRYRRDANSILQQIILQFSPYHTLYFDIDFREPWGRAIIPMHLTSGPQDNSDLEAGEAQRWIRHTFSFTIEGWLWEAFENISDIPATLIKPWTFTNQRRSVKTIRIDTYVTNGKDVLADTEWLPPRL